MYKLARKTSILKHKQRNLKKPIIFFFVFDHCQKYCAQQLEFFFFAGGMGIGVIA